MNVSDSYRLWVWHLINLYSRESCIAVKELICYVQWSYVAASHTSVQLPTCDTMLPSRTDQTQKCTDAHLFERDDSEVTCKYYTNDVQFYMKKNGVASLKSHSVLLDLIYFSTVESYRAVSIFLTIWAFNAMDIKWLS